MAHPEEKEPMSMVAGTNISTDIIGNSIGNYRVISHIGSGGMGDVYLAEHKLIGYQVAIKIMRRRFTQNADLAMRFFNEVKAATSIRHPSIVAIYDCGYYRYDRAYIVMEYLEGESLSDRIWRFGRLPIGQAVNITREIAVALGATHREGIVHRDLKPDNLILVREEDAPRGERTKILDFGVAKLLDVARESAMTRTGLLLGTPAYMSPEQCRGWQNIDGRADLYSLGCVLFKMLCGRVPFQQQGAGAILAAQVYDTPPRPSSIEPSIPEQLDEIVLKLLDKEADQRYADAQTLVDVLDTLPESIRKEDSGLWLLRPDTAPEGTPSHLKRTRSKPRSHEVSLVTPGDGPSLVNSIRSLSEVSLGSNDIVIAIRESGLEGAIPIEPPTSPETPAGIRGINSCAELVAFSPVPPPGASQPIDNPAPITSVPGVRKDVANPPPGTISRAHGTYERRTETHRLGVTGRYVAPLSVAFVLSAVGIAAVSINDMKPGDRAGARDADRTALLPPATTTPAAALPTAAELAGSESASPGAAVLMTGHTPNSTSALATEPPAHAPRSGLDAGTATAASTAHPDHAADAADATGAARGDTAAAAAVDTISIVIDSVPRGAVVMRIGDRVALGTTPFTDEMFAGDSDGKRTYLIRAPGYREQRLAVATDRDSAHKITLPRRPNPKKPRSRPTAPRDRSFNPFSN